MKKEKSRITSYNVDKLAGVSRSSVARAFTPNVSVSLKTREKVNKAAKKLGYHPNVIARSLITKKTQMIGLLMADWENPFYASALKKYSEKLQKENEKFDGKNQRNCHKRGRKYYHRIKI